MAHWILDFGTLDGLALAFVLLLASCVAWSVLASEVRARRLSRLDPPTAEELDEARALRVAGRFRLPGRESASARHFEATLGEVDRSSGGPGCYEPPMVDTWRDRRS